MSWRCFVFVAQLSAALKSLHPFEGDAEAAIITALMV
jgi:hypothetical protein